MAGVTKSANYPFNYNSWKRKILELPHQLSLDEYFDGNFKNKADNSFAFSVPVNIKQIKLFKIFNAIYCISLKKRVGLLSLIYCILEYRMVRSSQPKKV